MPIYTPLSKMGTFTEMQANTDRVIFISSTTLLRIYPGYEIYKSIYIYAHIVYTWLYSGVYIYIYIR